MTLNTYWQRQAAKPKAIKASSALVHIEVVFIHDNGPTRLQTIYAWCDEGAEGFDAFVTYQPKNITCPVCRLLGGCGR